MSVIATALRELMAAGVTGEALVAAVERIEAAQASAQGPARTARQDRNARYYENRKARLEASKASETVLIQTTKTVSDGGSEKEGPQTPIETTNTSEPPKGVSVSETKPRRKGSLCPDDFQPSEAHFAKAAMAGRGREFVVSIRDRMHRWSHTNASRAVAKKSDWSLALHDWIDRTLEEAGPQARSRASPSGPRVSGPTQHLIDKVHARQSGARHEPSFDLDAHPGRDARSPADSGRHADPARRPDESPESGGAGPVYNFTPRRAYG